MNIKIIRHKAGLTQKQFAEKLGVSIATVQAWEQGIRPITTAMRKLINLTEFTEGWV